MIQGPVLQKASQPCQEASKMYSYDSLFCIWALMWTNRVCMFLHLLCFSSISQQQLVSLCLYTKAECPSSVGLSSTDIVCCKHDSLAKPRSVSRTWARNPSREQKWKKGLQVTVKVMKPIWQLLSRKPHTTRSPMQPGALLMEWGGFSAFSSSQKVWTSIFWMKQHHPPLLWVLKEPRAYQEMELGFGNKRQS